VKVKPELILFKNFILRVDIVSFFFLDKYNEAVRRFKYNEYLNTHFFVKNQKFRSYFLRLNFFKKGNQANYFADLRNLFNVSLLNKKIFVFFFKAKALGYCIEHHPLIWYNVALNSYNLGLEKFKLKKDAKFTKFSIRLFLKENNLYMEYFFFKMFMRYYRRYLMEGWFYYYFGEVYLNIIRFNLNFCDLGWKVAKFFEKNLLKQQILNLNLTNFYIFFDFLNYNFLDKFTKLYLTESLNMYIVIEAVFCNYFSEIFIDIGYTFDEIGWSQIARFFEKFFVESVFDFYYLKNFSTILDYFCWRILNVDFCWSKGLFPFMKNSSFDWIYFCRWVLILNYFRELHQGCYAKGNLLNSRTVISFYVYRDVILKMAFSSYFLVILYFFLLNHQKIFKKFFFVCNKKFKKFLFKTIFLTLIDSKTYK